MRYEAAFELRLLPCLYSVTDERIISELLEKRVGEHAEAFERIEHENLKDIALKDFTKAVNSILEVSTIIKHEAFVNEKEERIRLFPVIREKKRLKQRLGIAQTIDFRR